MKLFLKKLGILSIVLFAFFFALNDYYNKRILLKRSDKGIWIQTFRDKVFDYAVIGSSRAQNVFSIKLADSLLDKHGINLGISGAAYAENLLSLNAFLANGNKANTILIQVDMWGLLVPDSAYSHPFSVHRYISLMNNSSYDFIFRENSNPYKFYLRKYIPFFAYAEFNNIYPLDQVIGGFKGNSGNLLDKEMGSEILKNEVIKINNANNRKERRRDLSLRSEKYLVDLVQLCIKNRIQVIFFTSPTKTSFLRNELSNLPAHLKFDSIAKKYKIEYCNLEADSICFSDDLFIDVTHVNGAGAAMLTKKVCTFIKPYLD